ncbi:MAG TPA: hypothetical protein DDW27_16825 [Bacteroidales bacterium]|nr:hypothetical protein [Bacteroidales bacterium]
MLAIQAIGSAVLKKEIFGFKKTLIVCPASIKQQWKKEIENFTSEKALVVSGKPEEREQQYTDNNYFFFIINYETVLRDQLAINRAGIDFLILDEAQRAKNYETKTSSSLKNITAKHKLVIPVLQSRIDLSTYFQLWEFLILSFLARSGSFRTSIACSTPKNKTRSTVITIYKNLIKQ